MRTKVIGIDQMEVAEVETELETLIIYWFVKFGAK